jgi:hypothetical protein
LLKVYGGGGLTLNFTTPLLSSYLVRNVQSDKDFTPEMMVAELTNPDSDIGQQIVQKILDELFTQRWGIHIVAGTHLKFPVVPIGLYVDGKLMIPISKYDADGEIKGLGVMFNTGLSIGF